MTANSSSPERPLALLEMAKRDSEERIKKLQIPPSSKLEIGATGLEVFGGIITGDISEHNRDWMDQKRFETVDLMRRGDSTVCAVLSAITLPVMAAQAHVVARKGKDDAEPDPVVSEAAEFIHDLLFTEGYMDKTWTQFIREGFLYLAYGHYIFEKVFKEVTFGPWSGAMGWFDFAPRHPRTMERWKFDKHGRVQGMVQRVTSEAAPNSSEEIELPFNKTLVFTNQSEAGNPLGVSVLRPAYKHWRYKDGFYAIQGIAIERQGAGVPFAKYPQGTLDADKDAAEEMLQNIQAHEQSYVMFAEDWDAGFLSMGSQTVLDPNRAIEHHDTMIAKAVLASFMNLPQDSRGSFALAENQTDFFNHTLQTSADYFVNVLNRYAIPELVDYNWPGLNQYPVVQFDRIGHLSTDRILTAINDAVKQGTMTPDIALENRVRELLNLPPIEEVDFEEAQEIEEEKGGPVAVPKEEGESGASKNES